MKTRWHRRRNRDDETFAIDIFPKLHNYVIAAVSPEAAIIISRLRGSAAGQLAVSLNIKRFQERYTQIEIEAYDVTSES